jgi:hypothetical protein
MFGDLFLWAAFSFLLWCFLEKPSVTKKTLIFVAGIFVFFVVQASKSDYRQKTWMEGQEVGFSSFSESASKNLDLSVLFSKEQTISNLSRLNQGWILASTAANLNTTQDFQGLNLVGLYARSAVLPRFLAPDKISSGDREIFNRFSGHHISEGTSMGLGVLADGYIAYGAFGVYLFAFALGLVFILVFKVVETWTDLSPFFVLFLYPIFFYAIRPDCETQTLLGHMVKSLIIFGSLVSVYKYYFKKLAKSPTHIAPSLSSI